MSTKISHEAIWRMEGGPLSDEGPARELLQSIFSVLGEPPKFYDLNQRDQWRDFEHLDRLVIDLLTQRTQLVTLSDRKAMSAEMLAAISTGKRASSPQVIARRVADETLWEAWHREAFWSRALRELNDLAYFTLKPTDDGEEGLWIWWLEAARLRAKAGRIFGEPIDGEDRLFMKVGNAGKVAASKFDALYRSL